MRTGKVRSGRAVVNNGVDCDGNCGYIIDQRGGGQEIPARSVSCSPHLVQFCDVGMLVTAAASSQR